MHNNNREISRLYRNLLLAFVFSFFVNILMLVIPIYSLQLFTRVLTSQSIETLIMLSLVTVFLLAVQSLIDLSRNHLTSASGINFSFRMAAPLLKESVKNKAHGTHLSTDPIKKLADVRNTLTSSAIYGLFDLPWAPIFLIAMFLIHPYLGWVALFGAGSLLTIGIVTSWLTSKHENNTQQLESETQELSRKIHDNNISILALGMVDAVTNRWGNKNQDLLQITRKSTAPITNLSIFTKLFRMLLQVSVMGLAIYLSLLQEVSAGAVIASSVIMSRALAPFEQAVSFWKHWKKGFSSFFELKTFIATLNKQKATIVLPEPKGHLTVNNLFYSYPTASEPFIKNINLQLEPGRIYGLVGTSGSGKTTLGKILIGCIPPTNGQVALDGADIHQWLDQDLGKNLGYLSQDIELLPGTVAENIGRFETDNSEDILDVAKLVGIHEMILNLPMGYETPIGLGGISLSGGQQQRIGLARALYKNPKFIVLDEPNANMDPESEMKLLSAIQKMKQLGACVVIITHKPSIISQTDQMIVMNSGEVTRNGKTKDLINSAKQEVKQRTRGTEHEQA